MQRVSSLDAGMLYAETPEMPMHTLGVLILERPPRSIFARLQRDIGSRLHLIEPFRRRLVEDPLRLGDPYWMEDPDFSLDNHLHRSAIRTPGGRRELAEFVGDLAGSLLDRAQPLWAMVLVEGLADGNAALVVKVHHAAMDGGRLVAMMNTLLDLSAGGRRTIAALPERRPGQWPSAAWFALDASRALVTRPFNALRALADIGATLLRGARSGSGKSIRADKARLFAAPRTPFNGALSRQRSVAMADVAFADVRKIRNAFGTTVNDVVLAASGGALRDWLLRHAALPDQPLIASVPVTVRSAGGADDAAGNRVSMILTELPLQTDDPVQRLLAIRAQTAQAKVRHGRGKGDVFRQGTDLLTSITVPWLLTQMIALYSRSDLGDRLPPLWNLVISNLPGPQRVLYCAGARVLRLYPFGPVQLNSGLNLTVMSSGTRLCLGAMACGRMVPDVELIADGFVREIRMLKKLAAHSTRQG